MDSRVRLVTKHLKSYDKDLFASRDNRGVIQVMRRQTIGQTYEYGGANLTVYRNQSQFIMSLTHNWLANGEPVEWGIEPLMRRIRYIDGHLHDDYDEFCEKRERQERIESQTLKNNCTALAADMRKDFNKVFGDINTSTMEKVDNRRKEDLKYANTKP